MFAIQGSPMLIQRPPLFLYLLAGAFHLFGADILTLRGLSAGLSLLTLLLIFLLTRKAFSPGLGLLAAFLYAVLPWVTAFNRIGFTYNLLTPLFLLALYACLELLEHPGWLWTVIGGISAGLAFCTDFIGAAAVLILLFVLLITGWKKLFPALGLILLVVFAVLAPILFPDPGRFYADTQFVMTARVNVGLLAQIVNIPLNSGELFRRESWVVLGIAGLFLLPRSKGRNLLLFSTALLLLVVLRTVTPVGRGLHYLIPLFPVFAIGLAGFIGKAGSVIVAVVRSFFAGLQTHLSQKFTRVGSALESIGVALVLFILVASPILWWTFASYSQSVYNAYFIFTGNDDLSFTSVQDAENVLNYIEDHSEPDDLVLASPQIAWASPTQRAAELPLALISENSTGDAYSHSMAQRFAYDCSLKSARYVILDPLARDFAVLAVPGIDKLIDEVKTTWVKVASSGEIDLYENPVRDDK
jgi:4-amino-4-deoxy-L-arabinose transferase-like glycosyltransferase